MPSPRRAWRPRTRVAALAGWLVLAATTPAGAAVVPVHLTARSATVKVAPGVRMHAWTFNGTVPGPVIRATEGDTVRVTLRNAHDMWHSVDFHAAQVAPNLAFQSVAPGKRKTFSFVARQPGVFMYHCGTAPLLEHVGMGMYGAIVIDPAAGRPPVAREITLVQSELYGRVSGGFIHPTLEAMRTRWPTFYAFNGRAFRYQRQPIQVPAGKPIRIYLVDAGPSFDSDFHVVGDVFDVVQPDGSPENVLEGVSTQLVPAGGGAMFELTLDEPGNYPFVSHSLRAADAGAVGTLVAR